MKRRKCLCLLLCALLLCALGGCALGGSDGEMTRLYYATADDVSYGSAVGYETVETSSYQDVPGLLRLWLAGPVDTQLGSTVPSGTAVRGYDITNGHLHIDFTEEYGQLSGVRLAVANYCVVLTVCQLENVDRVSITVAGRGLPGYTGVIFQPKDALLSGSVENPTLYDLQVYFPTNQDSGLGTEYRVIEVADQDEASLAEEVLDQLALGPSDEEMRGFLEHRSAFQVARVESGVCVLQLQEEALMDLMGENGVRELELYAIVDSIAEIDGIHAVQFRQNGAAVAGLMAEPYAPQYSF